MSAPRLRRTESHPKPRPGIVHLGPGAFFRAFNAPFTAEAIAASGGDWGIVAVSLQSTTARDQLVPQDGAYTAISLAPEAVEHTVVGAITEVLVASEDPSAVLAWLADPAIPVVSLTITEKGYPQTGDALNLNDADIAHDLTHPDAPRSAIGYLVRGLALRRAAGLRPFTVLSCDNLPGNGAMLRRLVQSFAARIDPALADWIAAEGAFPASMVDRITPATTAQDIADLAEAQGYHDPACVLHEPFRQWVIEDCFVDGARPDWAAAGAELVQDVSAHEAMKLRCLNGAHSTLAYLGYLAGHKTVADTVADAGFAALCQGLWRDEIIPTVTPPEGTDLGAYCARLAARFANPRIQHNTWQIAMDGSHKLPQRLLGPMAENRAAGRRIDALACAVAGWMRYAGGVDERGAAIDVRDPLARELRAASDSAPDDAGKVVALLQTGEVFPEALATDPEVQALLVRSYTALRQNGAAATVAKLGSGQRL